MRETFGWGLAPVSTDVVVFSETLPTLGVGSLWLKVRWSPQCGGVGDKLLLSSTSPLSQPWESRPWESEEERNPLLCDSGGTCSLWLRALSGEGRACPLYLWL